jgi:hypothetical protein
MGNHCMTIGYVPVLLCFDHLVVRYVAVTELILFSFIALLEYSKYLKRPLTCRTKI